MTLPEALGFGPFFADQMAKLPASPGLVAARVASDSRGIFSLAGCRAPSGELAGRLLKTMTLSERPTTGDWVAVVDDDDLAVIHHVLERRTCLFRRAVGSTASQQVLAANVDTFFIVTSANSDLSLRRIERYLTAVWNSGAAPVVVLNKVDLVDDPTEMIDAIEAIAIGVPIVGVSAQEGTEIDALRAHIGPGKTIGFVGSSGVGKSSLINRLLGGDAFATSEIRADGKGRHTTTRRELTLLSDGGIVIDSPGMREFGLVEGGEGLDQTFADVLAFAADCRFNDCAHQGEPDCAVQAAVESGELEAKRVQSYHRLQREIASIEARRDPVLGANTKRRWKEIHKNMRARSKAHPKGRG